MPRARFVAYATGGHMLVGHDAETAGEISAFLATYIKKR
jgi:hypothetical protein